ncbi:hypothetical protein [Rhodococcus sp. NPDC058514]|uniref:hypothetical protein n=1 Tax=unclassified Rhodococcus (in: high G+C Gram-positive bacteria) TaxID=192944 RepID=UPI00365A577C
MTSGLEYFAQFLPRAASIVPFEACCESLRARHEELTGLDPATMEADADAVGAAVAVLRAQCAAQEQLLLGLAAGWEGVAADAALATIGAHLEQGRATCEALIAVHEAMIAAAEVIRAAAVDVADVGRSFDATRIGGCSPQDVDVMIAVAALRPGDDAGGLLAQATGLFGELATAVGDALLGLAVEASTTWLHEVLVPHVRAQLAGFTELCDATAAAADGAHRLVADSALRVDPVPPTTVVVVVAEESEPYPQAADGREVQSEPAQPVPTEPEPTEPEPAGSEPEPTPAPVAVPPRTAARRGVIPTELDEPAEPAEPASGAELAEAGPL